MKKPNVYFIPSTKLGRDFNLPQLFEWGFSAVVLVNGAWRDRELGVPEAEQYVGKGLVYQNPFIYWYNHKNEKDYLGPRYETPDETVVVGGGLASLDVVKVLQLENYERALRARGIHTTMHELEKSIPEVCKAHGIKPEELGVKGCLLIYRRREQDMPLAQPPDNATPEQIAKTEQVRQKVPKRVVDCMKGDDGNAGAGAGSAEQQVASAMDAIGKQIEVIPQLSDDQIAQVERQVHALQQKAGFTSDYDSWIAKVTPPDLE